MTSQGLVHIYYGDGKGKTTAAIGLALRCAGHGGQVVIAQFLKDGTSGECTILNSLPNVTLLSCNPCKKFSFRMDGEEKACTADAVQACFQEAILQAKDAQMLVLDEAMAALSCGFLSEKQILEFLQTRAEDLEVVLTGRNPTEGLKAAADYLSEIQNRKHPYMRGIAARNGIER